jgi:hypothetical protein
MECTDPDPHRILNDGFSIYKVVCVGRVQAPIVMPILCRNAYLMSKVGLRTEKFHFQNTALLIFLHPTFFYNCCCFFRQSEYAQPLLDQQQQQMQQQQQEQQQQQQVHRPAAKPRSKNRERRERLAKMGKH